MDQNLLKNAPFLADLTHDELEMISLYWVDCWSASEVAELFKKQRWSLQWIILKFKNRLKKAGIKLTRNCPSCYARSSPRSLDVLGDQIDQWSVKHQR